MQRDDPIRDRIERTRGSVVGLLRVEPIYGPGLEFRRASEELRRLDLVSCLETLAILNVVSIEIEKKASRDLEGTLDVIGNLYGFLFHKKRLQRAVLATQELVAEIKQNRLGYFTPLSPWACSAMTNACLRFCDRSGGGVRSWPPSEVDAFGRVLLSFQKQLAPENDAAEAQLDLDNLSDLQFAEFSRNQIRANPHRFTGNDITRLFAMFEVSEVGVVLKKRAHVEPGKWFLERLGLTPTEYRFHLVALAAVTAGFSLDRPDVRNLYFDSESLTQHMTEEGRWGFSHLNRLAVVDVDQLRQQPAPQTWTEAVYKGNFLQRRQLYQTGPTRFLVLDRDHFLNRFFHGLLHVLHEAAELPDSKWSPASIRSDSGYIFEGYVQWWLGKLFGPTANILLNESLSERSETDAIVVYNGTAFIFEINHHWLSIADTFEASALRFAEIVSSDLRKAICAAQRIISDGLRLNGTEIRVERAFPVVVLPEDLPITDLTVARFHKELLRVLPTADGDDLKLAQSQIITQDHLEHFDRAWNLPEEVGMLADYLARRARNPRLRFAPCPLDRAEARATHLGNTWGRLCEQTDETFQAFGPSFFKNPEQSQ